MELIIAEKPKAALRIALALGNAKKKNYFGVPYYEIERQGKKIIVASAVGHLFILSETKKEKQWPSFNFEFKPINQVSKQKFALKYINALKKFKPDEITIACDYDIEGELIGYNILRYIYGKQDAYRMKFSTLTKTELIKAYENKLNNIDFNQAIAGETRHKLDWIYGINLSRLLMQVAKRILSIGRVQGPALSLLVSREKEIANFKPEKYWKIGIVVNDGKGNKVVLEYKERIKKKSELEAFKNLKGKEIVLNIDEREQRLTPFPPFNLTDLQIEAYRLYKIDPAKTLAIAQNLYLAGLISYPRTSSQKLPAAIGYNYILEKLSKFWKFKIERKRPIEGKSIDPAHPAIFPTGEKPKKIESNEKKIYDLIVKRFLSCFSNDALIKIKEIKVKVGGFEFKNMFKKIEEKGWLNIYPYIVNENWTDINKKVVINDIIIEEKETKPPSRYNPASLVKELEKRKLGTKGTRAMIVETLYKRGYVKGRAMKVTPLGIAVNDLLSKISPLILDESLTRKFELQLDKILISKNPLEEERKILEEAKKVILKIAEEWRLKRDKLKKKIESALEKLKQEQFEESKIKECVCGGYLILKKSRKGNYFVACSNWPNCTITFPLPKGKIKKIENKCNKCNWPSLRVILKNGKRFEICFNENCEEFWLKKVKDKEEKNENGKKKSG